MQGFMQDLLQGMLNAQPGSTPGFPGNHFSRFTRWLSPSPCVLLVRTLPDWQKFFVENSIFSPTQRKSILVDIYSIPTHSVNTGFYSGNNG